LAGSTVLILATCSAALAGLSGESVSGYVTTGVAAFIGAVVAFAGIVMLRLMVRLSQELAETRSQVSALINVRPLTGSLPVDLTGWAADPVLIDLMVRVIVSRKPSIVLECGSGWSTVLISRCLQGARHGRVIALEHDELFWRRSRGWLESHGAWEYADTILAPLRDISLNSETWRWYGVDFSKVLKGSIDILLVDGPPGELGRHIRYPAVPLLRPYFGSDTIVILDDGRRSDEAEIARRWSKELGVEPNMLNAGKGIWVFETGAPAELT
jgi:hypothetical protein